MSRNQELNQKMREERKAQIMEEALRQFALKGLYATKIKDIAEALGIAQGLVYHYFKSKEEIYVELVNNALDQMNDVITELKDTQLPPHEKIKVGISALLNIIDNNDDFTQTCRLIAQANNSESIPYYAKKQIHNKSELPYRKIAEIMEEGQKEGKIIEADPTQLALLFWTSINGLAIYKATQNENIKMPESKLLYKLFLKD